MLDWMILVFVGSVVVVLGLIATAPFGYEDEDGFHEIPVTGETVEEQVERMR